MPRGCGILQLIKTVWIFTALCYFSPHNDFKKAIVWLFCGLFPFSICQEREINERYLYERTPRAAAAVVHGAAQRDLHAGQLPVQHRGQPVCGADQRGRHDRPLAGIPHPELCQRHRHRLWYRHQRHDRPVPGCGRPQKGRDRRHPRHGAQPAARRGHHGGEHCHHAGLFAPVHHR